MAWSDRQETQGSNFQCKFKVIISARFPRKPFRVKSMLLDNFAKISNTISLCVKSIQPKHLLFDGTIFLLVINPTSYLKNDISKIRWKTTRLVSPNITSAMNINKMWLLVRYAIVIHPTGTNRKTKRIISSLMTGVKFMSILYET